MRALLVFAAAVPLLAQQAEPKITRLYVFGDSYSDTGAGYVDGDGPTAVAYLARRLGFELTASTKQSSPTQSLNFAVSGGQSGLGAGRKVKDALLGRGMMDQVDEFLGLVQTKAVVFAPEETLFFLAGGLNDRRLPSSETVANLESEIRKLYAAGGRRFRVALLPTAIPAFSAVGIRLNPELRKIPSQMQAEFKDAQVALSDWGLYFDDVMQNPSRYHIDNTKDKCAGRAIFDEDATACPNPSAFYYYHEGHPSTAVHKVVGDKLYDELTVAGKGK
ncbi:MAG TPA: SGNH/GDSL hydrolase family protein [Bryobacteraceae bacterium]|nr:SGNH/GDSL hydrolase family protein [Bryobacteraceae bacterium]